MPKMRTKKAVLKRFKMTKRGKIKRLRAFRSHLKSKKSAKRKRFLRGKALVSSADKHKIRKQLPYGS